MNMATDKQLANLQAKTDADWSKAEIDRHKATGVLVSIKGFAAGRIKEESLVGLIRRYILDWSIGLLNPDAVPPTNGKGKVKREKKAKGNGKAQREKQTKGKVKEDPRVTEIDKKARDALKEAEKSDSPEVQAAMEKLRKALEKEKGAGKDETADEKGDQEDEEDKGLELLQIPKQWDGLFTNLRWVLKARAKDDIQYNLKCLHIDNGFITATDGHRLHLWYDEDGSMPKAKGCYEVLVDRKSEIVLKRNDEADFPDFWSVLPTEKPLKLEDAGCVHNGDHSVSGFFSRIARLFEGNGSLNYNYVKDLADDECWRIWYFGDDKPFGFLNREETKMAVIMPMRA
jgi:hypothetical protein